MDIRSLPDAYEPDDWYVTFHPDSSIRWLAAITPGRFKHVSAFAYCAGFQAWLVYDVQPRGTRTFLLRAVHGQAGLRAWTRGCTVVKLRRRPLDGLNVARRLFLYCGPAIKHLVGVPGWGLTPTSIYKECLACGGEVIVDGALPSRAPAPTLAADGTQPGPACDPARS